MEFPFNNLNFIIMSIFSSLPSHKPKLTPHRLGHTVKFTSQFGQLQPTLCEKCVPGDVILDQVAHRIDFAPLSTKLLQEFRVKSESFFVPTRIMWKDFEDFFVEEENEVIHPYLDNQSLYNALDQVDLMFNLVQLDYYQDISPAMFGPRSLFWALYGSNDIWNDDLKDGAHVHQDALRAFAYFSVLREYYLDENLQSDLIDLFSVERFIEFYQNDAGNMSDWYVDTIYNYAYYMLTGHAWNGTLYDLNSSAKDNKFLFYCLGMILRNYPKDYFTGALPWKQKGNTVYIPSSTRSEIQFYIQNDADTTNDISTTPEMFMKFQDNANSELVSSGYKGVNLLGARHNDPNPVENSYLKAYTSAGAAVTSIEDFRTAYQVQQWLERNARGGTRYKEQILAHFGIKTKDSRLDRPEFIFGLTDVVNQGDVFTTFQNEAGDGVPAESVTRLSAAARSKSVSYRVYEHGYFITLYSIYPKAAYLYSVPRQSLELDKFDYFWPEFEHLGEQEVFNAEVCNSHQNDPLATFGYQPRYSQYKHRDNIVRGEFVNNLKTFTLARDFNDAHLNGVFIAIDPNLNNLNRCFNVVYSNYDKIYFEVFNNLNMLRPMSYFGVPRLVL